MPFNFKERAGAHPYLHAVWCAGIRGQESLVVSAKSTWDIIVIEGPSYMCVQLWAPHKQPQRVRLGRKDEITRYTGLRFETGVYVPQIIQRTMHGRDSVDLINQAGRFRLGEENLPIPTYETAELVTDALKEKKLLLLDKTIKNILGPATIPWSARTIQRRFLHRTDMSKMQVKQLQRAEYVASLLYQGRTLSEAAAMAGFADQAHMTRIFKVQFGMTPRNFCKRYMDPN